MFSSSQNNCDAKKLSLSSNGFSKTVHTPVNEEQNPESPPPYWSSDDENEEAEDTVSEIAFLLEEMLTKIEFAFLTAQIPQSQKDLKEITRKLQKAEEYVETTQQYLQEDGYSVPLTTTTALENYREAIKHPQNTAQIEAALQQVQIETKKIGHAAAISFCNFQLEKQTSVQQHTTKAHTHSSHTQPANTTTTRFTEILLPLKSENSSENFSSIHNLFRLRCSPIATTQEYLARSLYSIALTKEKLQKEAEIKQLLADQRRLMTQSCPTLFRHSTINRDVVAAEMTHNRRVSVGQR